MRFLKDFTFVNLGEKNVILLLKLVRVKQILKTLDKYGKLSKESKALLTEMLEPIDIEKGFELIPELHVSPYIFFIEKGALKNHYIDEKGNKNIVWFGFEGDMCFSLSAYFDIPYYHECIEVLEDSLLYRTRVKSFRELYQTSIEWSNWGRRLAEHHLIKLYYEIDEHRPMTAKERYQNLIENNQNIQERITLKDIASYLGVSPVTISRFRKE